MQQSTEQTAYDRIKKSYGEIVLLIENLNEKKKGKEEGDDGTR